LDGWAEFGLSRFSASRGLHELERAGLVYVHRTPGRPPDVAIMDVGTESNRIGHRCGEPEGNESEPPISHENSLEGLLRLFIVRQQVLGKEPDDR
jgi:hypothetical protein